MVDQSDSQVGLMKVIADLLKGIAEPYLKDNELPWVWRITNAFFGVVTIAIAIPVL